MKVIATFEECPDCKVDARLVNTIVQEEIAKGNMSEDVLACTGVAIVGIADPKKPFITGGRMPGARISYDICTKCGRQYTVKIEIGHITPPTHQGMPPVFS